MGYIIFLVAWFILIAFVGLVVSRLQRRYNEQQQPPEPEQVDDDVQIVYKLDFKSDWTNHE